MLNTPLPEHRRPANHVNAARGKADREFQDLLKLKFKDPQDARVVRRVCTRAILALSSAKSITDIIAIYDTAENELKEYRSPAELKARPEQQTELTKAA